MTKQFLMALVGFAFVTSVTPGPNNLMVLASGVNFGFQRTIPHMLGVGLGFVFMIMALGLGIVQVFIACPVLPGVLIWVSFACMLRLAAQPAAGAPIQRHHGALAGRFALPDVNGAEMSRPPVGNAPATD